MINIVYDQKNMELKIDGHANSAPMGEDLVCAGVTVLTVALGCALQDAKTQGLLEEYVHEDKNGLMRIKAVPKEEYVGNIKIIFATILNGYDALGSTYKEYVTFKVA